MYTKKQGNQCPVSLTLYTLHTENEKLFLVFLLLSEMALNVRKLHFSFYFERSGLSTLSSFAAVYSIRMAIFVIF